jgi:hypothetical protein
MHGDDDQIVPYADAGPLSAKLLPNGTLKTYSGYAHGAFTTHADVINPDLLEFHSVLTQRRNHDHVVAEHRCHLLRRCGTG